MIRKYLAAGIFSGAVFGAAMFIALAQAEPSTISFPIPELGNCESQEACKTYCAELDHAQACTNFAEAHGLMTKDEAAQAKKLAGKPGPGGCRGEACRTYCEDVSHHEECLKFAEENGFISKEDAKEFKKGGEVLKKFGSGPGGCTSESVCKAYCDSGDHTEECVEFGVKAGFISREEAANIKKFSGKGPGGCRGEACKTYCEDPNNMEECVSFGLENGFITKEQAEQARKFANKTGPGGCRGEQCKTYCEDEGHREECLKFAQENGLISKEDAERSRQFINKTGPGGCKGEACRTYCDGPDHEEECFAFAKEHDLIPKDQQEQFERGRTIRRQVEQNGGPGGCKGEDACHQYCADPEHSEECVNFAAQSGGINKEDAQRMLEEFKRSKEFGQQLRDNPDSFQTPNMPGQGGGFGRNPRFIGPPTSFKGPGGCSSPQECQQFCSDESHREECVKTFRSAPVEADDHERRMPPFEGSDGSFRGQRVPPPEAYDRPNQINDQRFDPTRGAPEEREGFRNDSANQGSLPAFQNKGEIHDYVRENCAKFGGTYDGARCNQATQPDAPEFLPQGTPPPESFDRPPTQPAPEFHPEGEAPPPESFNKPPDGTINDPPPSQPPSSSVGPELYLGKLLGIFLDLLR